MLGTVPGTMEELSKYDNVIIALSLGVGWQQQYSAQSS